jgi:Fic family protein
MYESLYKIYYKRNAEWQDEYQRRFNGVETQVLPLMVSQYGHSEVYPAFFCYTKDAAVLQERIRQEFSECQKLIYRLPQSAISLFLRASIVDEVKSTNDIEGVHSTRKEIRQALSMAADERKGQRMGSLVDTYLRLLAREEISFAESRDVRVLYDAFLADEIRAEDEDNLPDGEIFRRNSVDIVSASQKVVHRGLYPEAKIIASMDQSLAILSDETIPIFYRVALFHYFFGYIHPFYDGNGRLSRFITAYYLAKELDPVVALQLSVLMKRNRKKYYELFSVTDAAINCGDMTPFIIGMLEFIAQTVSYTRGVLAEKEAAYLKGLARLQALDGVDRKQFAFYDLLLQAAIFSDCGVTMQDIRKVTGKSENTVYTYLNKIPENMLLVEKKYRPYHYRLNLAVESL